MADSRKEPERSYGTVIIFTDDLTESQREAVLKELQQRGLIESHCGICSYNPDHGSPVWYIP
jgi:hypothetical protein